MRNIRVLVAFDGTEFHGWQVQPAARTVQGVFLDAIAKITGEHVSVTGSGRTDAGAHARGLVANFHTASRIPPAHLVRALNSALPRDVRVLSARAVSNSFHARRDALSKTYKYQVFRGGIMPPHLAREYYHYPYRIDLDAMTEACGMLLGQHDFASFAAKSGKCRSGDAMIDRNTVRCIFGSKLAPTGHRLYFTLEGDGFLHHMVRNIVGTLLEVGRGRTTLEEYGELFKERDRDLAGFTAPAHGLILSRVSYKRGSPIRKP
jgi:tRNA pseudouridine38-40 synthase